MSVKTILSVCDYSGVWSGPYAKAGYEVTRVDIAYPKGIWKSGGQTVIGADIREWRPERKYNGILLAPDCSCFCRPGSRWWWRMDKRGETKQAVEVFLACLFIGQEFSLDWWALENPPGRHKSLIPDLAPPSWQYHPWEYGDPWGKQTYIWGTAKKPPVLNPVKPAPTRRAPSGHTQGRIAWLSGHDKRSREETPKGFAEAFFAANP